MLKDLMEFIIAPYPWHLAPMGYLRELNGISRRVDQCARSWNSHLDATRDHIARTVLSCPRRHTAMVIGSGWLLDVPLENLSAAFERVLLVDIFHPRSVRRLVSQYDNVALMQMDVTGIAKPVFDYVRKRRPGGLPVSRAILLADLAVDLVISVNTLSQLAVIPRQYLMAHRPDLPPYVIENFCRNIVEAHLTWLSDMSARAVLITDYERIECGPDGDIVQKDILEGVSLPPPDARWSWDIAPLGSVYRDVAVRHEVKAYLDFKSGVTTSED